MSKMQFRTAINTAMKKKDISIYRLAKETGITNQMLYRYFDCKSELTGGKLEKICDVLGLELKPNIKK